MFNFTTQTIYNSIISDEGNPNRNMWVVDEDSPKPALRIGNTRFDKEFILDINIKNPTVENLAEVCFDMTKIVEKLTESELEEITGRIALYIGLSMNSHDSLYSNALLYKGKPLYVEFPVKKDESADAIAKKVKQIADKYFLFMFGEKILSIVVDRSTVTFKGVNGYQQIKKAALQWFDPNAKTLDCCSNIGEYVDIIIGVPVIYTTDDDGVVTITQQKVGPDGEPTNLESNEVAVKPGIEAFCDYNWIIHNLRLPTLANTNYWAPTRTEMPAVGQIYTQFIIRICKERDGISGEIVGARAKSVTTHVLYVAGKTTEQSCPAALVKAELEKLLDGKSFITDADEKLKTPFEEVLSTNDSGNNDSGNNDGGNNDGGDNP